MRTCWSNVEEFTSVLALIIVSVAHVQALDYLIDGGDHYPIKQPPRRVTVVFVEEEKVIKQMENQGII